MRVDDTGSVDSLVFGCASLGSRVGESEGTAGLLRAYAHGIRRFDVAPSYGYGAAEGILGRALVSMGTDAIVYTKVGIDAPPGATTSSVGRRLARKAFSFAPGLRSAFRPVLSTRRVQGKFEPQDVRASVERSLRNLGRDSVDILFLHEPPLSLVQRDDLFDELSRLKNRGLYQSLGAGGQYATTLQVTQARSLDALQSKVGAFALEDFTTPSAATLTRIGNGVFTSSEKQRETLAKKSLGPIEVGECLMREPLLSGRVHQLVFSSFSAENLQRNIRAFTHPLVPDHEVLDLIDSLA